MNTYEAKILADSSSPEGVRLTTLQVTFPRFILAEVNTHRVLSRNSASSRAIPPEKQIARVREHCFVPETFNRRVKGMGGGDPLEADAQLRSEKAWREAAEKACAVAERLIDEDVDKARVNRLLEPFLWHTAIISATEWSNFFALRDHPDAQPEFQIVARMMKEAMFDSVPHIQPLDYGWWHLPLVSEAGLAHLSTVRERASAGTLTGEIEPYKLVSVGRCARVSFDTHENYEPPEASVERAERLKSSGHFSPFEHVARPALAGMDFLTGLGARSAAHVFFGNFRGWVQFRREIPHESDFSIIRQNQES